MAFLESIVDLEEETWSIRLSEGLSVAVGGDGEDETFSGLSNFFKSRNLLPHEFFVNDISWWNSKLVPEEGFGIELDIGIEVALNSVTKAIVLSESCGGKIRYTHT